MTNHGKTENDSRSENGAASDSNSKICSLCLKPKKREAKAGVINTCSALVIAAACIVGALINSVRKNNKVLFKRERKFESSRWGI
jgi:hypothetical protein